MSVSLIGAVGKARQAALPWAIFLAFLFVIAGGQWITEAQKKPPAKPINLNTATIEQLEQLPGVGPVTAKDIIQFRQKSGPFRSVNDLLAIRRITKARLEKLRPYVTVGPPAAKPHANPPKGAASSQ